jgi:hypothetical protein
MLFSVTEGAGEPGNVAHVTTQEQEEGGDLLDYNDSSVLEQFHEDAIRQV